MAWFIALTLYTPDSVAADRTEMDVGGSASQYLRAAWMPKLGLLTSVGAYQSSAKTSAGLGLAWLVLENPPEHHTPANV